MIKTCIPTQAKIDFLSGNHSLICDYKIVLYTSEANLDEDTMAYTAKGEASGKGYTKGGHPLENPSVWEDRGAACLTFASFVLPNASITARGFMIVNASCNNRVVCIVDWGADYTSTEGDFRIQIAADQIVFD